MQNISHDEVVGGTFIGPNPAGWGPLTLQPCPCRACAVLRARAHCIVGRDTVMSDTPLTQPTPETTMGDTIQEIEDALTKIEALLPTVVGIVGVFVPGAGAALTLATPFLSIVNEILAAIETLKTGGMSHPAAVAMVGAAVTRIGQNLSSAAPPAAVKAAAPVATL